MSRDYRRRPRRPGDIGEVVSPIERLTAAREVSSCCVGVEAMLESGDAAIDQRLRQRRQRQGRRDS